MNILVTDGENRSSLAVTRSLGRKGCTIIAVGRSANDISFSSKFCHKAYLVPDPLTDGMNYLHAISEIVAKERINVIFPMTEQSVYCLNKSRNILGQNVILACAPPDKMEAVSNKYTLFKTAEKLGVDVPKTNYVADIGDFYKIKNKIKVFPVVVKPAFSKIQDGDKIFSTGVMFAANQAELNHLYESQPVLRYPSLIQEMITGIGTGLFTLFDQDRHLVLFSHRRLLEKPPSGGVSVLSESIAVENDMVEASRKLLSNVHWTGIAMVEFKRDVRDGRPKLMEINGRFWGSLQLAISSGVDFPELCLDYYLGKKKIFTMPDYTVGHKLKWSFGILDHMIIRLKKRHTSQNLHPEVFTIWQVAKELLEFGSLNSSSDVFDIRDLMPFVAESKEYIKNLLGANR